jgi:hypothetical protein
MAKPDDATLPHFTWDHIATQMEDLYNSINSE